MTEWLKVLLSKSSVPATVPWVRIPLSPPLITRSYCISRGGLGRGGFLPIGGKGFDVVDDGLPSGPEISGAEVGGSRCGASRKLPVSAGESPGLEPVSLGVLPRADGLSLR